MSAPSQVAGAASEEASAVAGAASSGASEVASTAAGAASEVAGTVKQEAGDVVATAAEQARDLTGQVKEQASAQVQAGSQKVTGTLRDLSTQLSEGDTSGVVGMVLGEAGSRVQRLADHLEQVGPQGLLEEAADYARRNPGTFLLGMAAAGFITGRLVKGMGVGSSGSSLSGSSGSSGAPAALPAPVTTPPVPPAPYTTVPPGGDLPAAPGSGYSTGYPTTSTTTSSAPGYGASPYPEDGVSGAPLSEGTQSRGAL